MVKEILIGVFRIKKFVISFSILVGIILMGIVGPIVYAVVPYKIVGPPEARPSQTFPLGTDAYGRDLFAQVLNGIRTSIYIGFLSAIAGTAIGVVIGTIAGFKGGLVDDLLMVVTNIMMTLPAMLLMILVAVYIKERNVFYVALIISFTSWGWIARGVRAQIMSLREQQFVFMSRMAGLSDARIAFADLLPNMASYVFMCFILLMSAAMLAEAGLSMIGLGVTSGYSLGTILFWARIKEAVRRGLTWWFIPPGAILVAITTSLLVTATALDEYFSPRLRGS